MTINPLLWRESIVSIGRGRGGPFRDRVVASAMAGTALGALLLYWDWRGWDRASAAGASSFACVGFELVVAVQACLSIVLVLPTARAIASERDGKTLDALLATRLSGPQVVVGVMAAGLLRFANGAAATLPPVVLMGYLGGVDPSLALVAGLGLASTALSIAALSAVASVGSRTAGHAVAASAGLLHGWFVLPTVLLMLRGLFLPTVPTWLVKPLLWALDSSPLGPAASHLGIMPRPWGLAEGVVRMSAIQVAVAVVLTAWAACRLRPASRALYDVEGRAGMLRALRAANRRLPRRRPCGDDPVLWGEMHSLGGKGRLRRVADRLARLACAGLFAVGVWWFAAPAFAELSGRGYGPSARAYEMPEINPLARVLVEHLIVRAGATAEPGQARLEFNLAIRQFTAMGALGFAIAAFSLGSEAVARERRRDTWLGLLATPLSGRDVVRGKVLGALWRGRETPILLAGVWAVGLASGAIHPLGFLAAVAWLAAAGPLYAALGVATALREDRPKWPPGPSAWLATLAAMFGMILLVTVLPMTLAAASPFTYEDVQAATVAGAFPPFSESSLRRWVGARGVLLACLAGIAATWALAAASIRSLTLSFDALAGRPCRPPGGDDVGVTSD